MAKGIKKPKEVKKTEKAIRALKVKEMKKELKRARKKAKKEEKRMVKVEKKAYAKALKKANSDKFLAITAILLTAASTALTIALDKREKSLEEEETNK
ncbi:MAG: hypothetical protein IJJ74_09310 [Eubacterium sp.]|nr:hypothetical protein [Eubacterium sp.]